ncbi:MAG TPA: trypsin-like peptidase domain-containing protein [Baekduia sp.]|nr:trypsin-like peptidase domain-containing protein [Baekduia sp.]
MRRGVAAGLAALALGAAGGCGGGDGGGSTTVTVVPTATTTAAASSGAPATTLDAEAVYRREAPGVVTILAGGFGSGESGLGSGFVVGDDGRIATNAHVVTTGQGRAIREAGEVYVRFADGNEVRADIVGYDPFADVALLTVDPEGLDLRPLPFGDVGAVDVGAPVAAIGSPFGEEQSLSVGVISAKDRDIESLTGFQISGALQTDAAINSGNSGGPLLDGDGRVLGINSQIRTTSGAGSGVGFAVPANVVRRSLEQLRRDGHVRYAYLGISTRQVYPQAAEHFDLGADSGAAIQTVAPGGPAARAGLRGGTRRETFQGVPWRVGGDVITKVGSTPIRHDSDISTALLAYLPGQTAPIEIVRDGEHRTVQVRFGTRPLQTPAG